MRRYPDGHTRTPLRPPLPLRLLTIASKKKKYRTIARGDEEQMQEKESRAQGPSRSVSHVNNCGETQDTVTDASWLCAVTTKN